MFCKYVLLLFLCLFKHSFSYVLLQISKDEHNNRSNVDALIHRVIPTVEVDKIAKDLSRKQLTIPKKNPKPLFKSSKYKDRNSDNNVWDIQQAAVKAVRELFLDNLLLRTNFLDFQPKKMNFKSDSPTLVYEINSDTVLGALKSLLTSNLVKDYTDKMAEKAAMVYRTLNNNN